MIKTWYAVYTKPKSEAVVSKLMTKRKVINYYPENNIKALKNSTIIEYKIPLFPNFVFVNILDQQMEWIKSQKGVINFLYWLGRPVQLRNSDIDQLMNFVEKFINIKVQKIPVQLKSMMLIDKVSLQQKSPFQYDEEGMVSLTLSSLGFCLKAFSDPEKDPATINGEHKIQSEWDMYYSKY